MGMTSAAIIMLLASIVLLTLTLTVSVFAYWERQDGRRGVLILIGICLFVITSLLFVDTIVRIDEAEGTNHRLFEIKSPFSIEKEVDNEQ